MEVDTLKKTGAASGLTIPEITQENKSRQARPAEVDTEDKHEKSDMSVRSGRQRTAVVSGKIKGAVINAPLKAKNIVINKNAIEFDRETEQFRIVKKTIESANKRMIGGSSMFQYSIHDQTKQIMIRVVDKETNELLLEIPPEKALDAIAKMWELAGIFVDEKR